MSYSESWKDYSIGYDTIVFTHEFIESWTTWEDFLFCLNKLRAVYIWLSDDLKSYVTNKVIILAFKELTKDDITEEEIDVIERYSFGNYNVMELAELRRKELEVKRQVYEEIAKI